MAEHIKVDAQRTYLVSEGYTGCINDLLRAYYTVLTYSGNLTDQSAAAKVALSSTNFNPVVEP